MITRGVVVAHHEPMLAEGLAAALGRFPNLRPVAVSSAADAEVVARRLPADSVVIDGSLPGGEDTASRLAPEGFRVIFLRQRGGERGGAAAMTIAEDRRLVSVHTDGSVTTLASLIAPEAAGPRLTRREEQILQLIARGRVAKEIARELGLSVKTIERHKTKMFARLGVTNQAAAVAVVASFRPQAEAPWSPSTT